jgi:oligopeptide/dipeptide ABC transporter ATP-binding protein
MSDLLKIKGLKIYFYTYEGIVKAVENVNLNIKYGETLGLVGETGCGKSVTALSILKLIPPPGKIISGEILLEGKDITKMSEDEMRSIRGKDVAMIFQDPTSSLNPVYKIGDQLLDVIMLHQKLNRDAAWEKAVELLKALEVPSPETRMHNYPFELSGGMRQRVMIAMALSCRPKLLIADEPTTNLDVTVQAQILEIMRNLKKDFGSSLLLITHDLGIVAEMANRVAIMYAGRIVEYSDVTTILEKHKHPYVEGLLNSLPNIHNRKQKLISIPGMLPSLINPPSGCRFHPRCQYSKPICKKIEPELLEVEPNHHVACHLFTAK